jgi:hypothetical protein
MKIHKAKSYRHFAHLKLCTHIGACDIGQAKIGSRTVYITWGRNFKPDDTWMHSKIGEAVQLPAGHCELVLPDEYIHALTPVLFGKPSKWSNV